MMMFTYPSATKQIMMVSGIIYYPSAATIQMVMVMVMLLVLYTGPK
jgi:hypothetical protein